MKNINCKNCGESISQKAPTCPKCGHPNKQSKNISGSQAVVAVVVGLGIIWYMNSNPTGGDSSAAPSLAASDASPTVVPAYQVSALQLFSDYQANEVSADGKYKGKRLAVTGIVDSINKDFLDKVFIALRTPNEFMSIHAELEPSQVSRAGALAKGVRVTVLCNGGGMIVGSPMLSDCTLQ